MRKKRPCGAAFSVRGNIWRELLPRLCVCGGTFALLRELCGVAVSYEAVPEQGTEQQQGGAGDEEDGADAEGGAERAAEQRADHSARLVRGGAQTEDAPTEILWGGLHHRGIDGGQGASHRQPKEELQGGEAVELRGEILHKETGAAAEEGETHGACVSACLAETSPGAGRDSTGDAAEAEHDACVHDDIGHRALELGYVEGDDRLQHHIGTADRHGQEQHKHEQAVGQGIAAVVGNAPHDGVQ